MWGTDRQFQAAQRAWDSMEPDDGPELPEDYPRCKWCDEPTGDEYREWDGVKKPSPNEDYCEDCWEKHSCAKCKAMHENAENNELCPSCQEAHDGASQEAP